MKDTNVTIPTRLMQSFNSGHRLVGFDTQHCRLAVACPTILNQSATTACSYDLERVANWVIRGLITQLLYGESFHSFDGLVHRFKVRMYSLRSGVIFTFVVRLYNECNYPDV